jgi:competence protein ComEA
MKRYRLLAILAVLSLMLATPLVAQTKPAAKAATAKVALLDINSASKADLSMLTGVGDALAQKIIDGRPYTRKDQLVSKMILPQATYDKVKGQIVARQAKKK